MIYNVYWIKHREHTALDQGYIGISNNFNQRFRGHKKKPNSHLSNAFAKYGDDIQVVVLLAGSKEYCLFIEEQLRPVDNIGWNIVKGGGYPPRSKPGQGKGRKQPGVNKGENHPMWGKHKSEETKQKQRKPKTTTINMKKPKSESHKENMRKAWLTRPPRNPAQFIKMAETKRLKREAGLYLRTYNKK